MTMKSRLTAVASRSDMKRKAIAALAVSTMAGGAIAITTVAAPVANACTPIHAQGGGWGDSTITCNQDGSASICDRGWAPFVGQIVNCFHAPKGHPRNP